MKHDGILEGAAVAAICLACLILGITVGCDYTEKRIHKQAISHGHAIYNPTNGVFMWKERK